MDNTTSIADDDLRKNIATYLLARQDSTLVSQVSIILEAASGERTVALHAGDAHIANLVLGLLESKGIVVVDKAEGQSINRIYVPDYIDNRGSNLAIFDDTWDRPMIVAQTVGEAMSELRFQGKPSPMLDSSWLFWAMFYRGWPDISGLRDFVINSIFITAAKMLSLVEKEVVFAEFCRAGKAESLFPLGLHFTKEVRSPFFGREPVEEEAKNVKGIVAVFDRDEWGKRFSGKGRSERWINYEFYINWLATIVAHDTYVESQSGSSVYQGYPIHFADTLSFLRNIEWWERKTEVPRGWPKVVQYCSGGLRLMSPDKQAVQLGMTVRNLSRWLSRRHLKSDFGRKWDGYLRWAAAREGLGVGIVSQSGPSRRSTSTGSGNFDPVMVASDFKWEDIGIELVSSESIAFHVPSNSRHERAFYECGLANRKNKGPKQCWFRLVEAIRNNGLMCRRQDISPGSDRSEKREIKNILCQITGIQEDPFAAPKTDGWNLKSKIVTSKQQQAFEKNMSSVPDPERAIHAAARRKNTGGKVPSRESSTTQTDPSDNQ